MITGSAGFGMSCDFPVPLEFVYNEQGNILQSCDGSFVISKCRFE